MLAWFCSSWPLDDSFLPYIHDVCLMSKLQSYPFWPTCINQEMLWWHIRDSLCTNCQQKRISLSIFPTFWASRNNLLNVKLQNLNKSQNLVSMCRGLTYLMRHCPFPLQFQLTSMYSHGQCSYITHWRVVTFILLCFKFINTAVETASTPWSDTICCLLAPSNV